MTNAKTSFCVLGGWMVMGVNLFLFFFFFKKKKWKKGKKASNLLDRIIYSFCLNLCFCCLSYTKFKKH